MISAVTRPPAIGDPTNARAGGRVPSPAGQVSRREQLAAQQQQPEAEPRRTEADEQPQSDRTADARDNAR
jgi:hypothetical protein